MLLDEVVICPRRPVLKVLEQGRDGSLLYTTNCVSEGSSQLSTEVRLYEPSKDRDHLMYMHHGSSIIVNGSLNPDRNVFSFTILESRRSHVSSDDCSPSSPATTFLDGQASSSDKVQSSDQAGSNWIYCKNSNPQQDNGLSSGGEDHLSTPYEHQTGKGKYVSFLADVNPTKWVRKFDAAHHYYQRVIFTNCNVQRNMNGEVFFENRLLLIMHRRSIGLYTILLKPTKGSQTEKKSGPKNGNQIVSLASVEISSVLQSVTIVSKAFWSQWIPDLQLLYYLIVSRKKQKKESGEFYFTFSTSLCCEQFSDQQTHQQMFVIPVHLGLDPEIFTDKTSSYLLLDMQSTVSSSHLNMNLLHLRNGIICLCWQTLGDCQSTNDKTLYRILVFNKDVLLQCTSAESSSSEASKNRHPISFSSLGSNIFVHSPSLEMHLLAIDTLTNDPEDFVYHDHYVSKCSEQFERYQFHQMPYQSPLTSDISTNNQCYMFDQQTKSIVCLSLNRKKISETCFDIKTSLENKIALSRYGCVLMRHQPNIINFTHLPDVLLKFLSKEVRLKGSKILASLLLQMAANDVAKRVPEAENLHDLLPTSVPIKFFQSREYNFDVSTWNIKDDVKQQIDQYVDKVPSLPVHWKNVCKSFSTWDFKHYSVLSTDEEMKVIGGNFKPQHLQDQKNQQLKRLNEIFVAEILQPTLDYDLESEEENVLDCFSSHDEMDQNCENIMALTYERLLDHLKEYIPEEKSIKLFARSYVIAQLRVVNHVIALFLLVTKVDDHDRPLFHPVDTEERNLLNLLNFLLSACISINFPLPHGFHTFLTCLTFRCCLTTHLLTTSDESIVEFSSDTSSSSISCKSSQQPALSHFLEDIKDFSFEFLQLVDSSCIHLTDEFVARLLEELPNHELYGSFVHQVLERAKFKSPSTSEGILQLWKNPHSCSLLAKLQLDKLENIKQNRQRTRRKTAEEDVVKSATEFLPLDIFLKQVKQRASKLNVDVDYVGVATMQNTIRKFGKENLKHIAF